MPFVQKTIVITSCTNATFCFRANVTEAKVVCFYIVPFKLFIDFCYSILSVYSENDNEQFVMSYLYIIVQRNIYDCELHKIF